MLHFCVTILSSWGPHASPVESHCSVSPFPFLLEPSDFADIRKGEERLESNALKSSFRRHCFEPFTLLSLKAILGTKISVSANTLPQISQLVAEVSNS